MNRIGLVGASGRTGRHVIEALTKSTTSSLEVAIVSPQSPSLGIEVGTSGVRLSDDLQALARCDGVIDFSVPASTVTVANLCAQFNKPLLVATTGLSNEQMDVIQQASNHAPICLAPNTSLAASALKMAARYLKDILGPAFDVEVMEIHHRMKRDAPSGTALNVIAAMTDSEPDVVFGRRGLRKDGEIGVVSLRGGDVPGDHTVYFLGEGERIELTQRAQSRYVFGAGAVALIERLLRREPGLYCVEDLLVGG